MTTIHLPAFPAMPVLDRMAGGLDNRAQVEAWQTVCTRYLQMLGRALPKLSTDAPSAADVGRAILATPIHGEQ